MSKTVSKSEMALQYFPKISKGAACRKLIRFIQDNPIWSPEKEFKTRRYFTNLEVKQIEEIMG